MELVLSASFGSKVRVANLPSERGWSYRRVPGVKSGLLFSKQSGVGLIGEFREQNQGSYSAIRERLVLPEGSGGKVRKAVLSSEKGWSYRQDLERKLG